MSSQDRLGKISDERTGADKRRIREEKRREEDDSYLFLYLLFTGLSAFPNRGEYFGENGKSAARDVIHLLNQR